MRIRRSSATTGALGLALIALAPGVRLGVMPMVTKLPTDASFSFEYSGTIDMLDAAALASGDTGNAFVTDLPITMRRTVRVKSATSDTAVIEDEAVVDTGEARIPSTHLYAVDRKTLIMTAAPNDAQVEAPLSSCLAGSFPVSPDPETSYQIYDPATRTCVPAQYQGEATVSGRKVYEYLITADGALRDAVQMAALPTELPKEALAGLGSALPRDMVKQLTAVLDSLPDPVSLTYLASSNILVSVDAQTGAPLRQEIEQSVAVALAGQSTPVPIADVLSIEAELTPQSAAELTETASAGGRFLMLGNQVVPAGLIILGTALGVFAVILQRRRPARSAVSTADRRLHSTDV